MDESKRAYRHSALGRFSSPQTRWHARLANDLARLATVDVDVRRISNPPFKIKNLWVMTRVAPWATIVCCSIAILILYSLRLPKSCVVSNKMFRDEFSYAGQVAHGGRRQVQRLDFGQRPDFGLVREGAAEPIIFPAGDAELVAGGAHGGEFLCGFIGEFLLQEPDMNRDSFVAIFRKNLRATNRCNFFRRAHKGVHLVSQRGFKMSGDL